MVFLFNYMKRYNKKNPHNTYSTLRENSQQGLHDFTLLNTSLCQLVTNTQWLQVFQSQYETKRSLLFEMCQMKARMETDNIIQLFKWNEAKYCV